MSAHTLDPRNQAPHIFLERATALGLSTQNARRMLGAVLGKADYDPKSWLNFGIITKQVCASLSPLPRLTLEKIVCSAKDGFQKLLFRTHDELAIESVVIPLHKVGQVSLCLSSQVGCVMGCTFCATARMAQRRNLQTWEIIDQYIQTRTHAWNSGRKVSGVVFMGMGEPFLNYERVLAAAELLSYPVLNAIEGRGITISTVGLVQEIDRFTSENRPFRLSISLGAATDVKRAKLVPVAARTPVAEVMAAARRYAQAREDRVNLAYVCISGENVGEEDALALGQLIGDTPVRLDLIEVNDTSGHYQAPNPEEMSAFRDALTKYVKQPVARRYSGGGDIRAACGTLAGA